MTQQSELEKTQAELAKLQLERERFKFAQQQKRQKVVDNLGAGAVSVGKATGRVVGGTARFVCAVIVGAAGAMFYWASHRLIDEFFVAPVYPGASVMFRVGATLGAQHYNLIWVAIVGAIFGVFWAFRSKSRAK